MSKKVAKKKNFIYDSLGWLARNYIEVKGLRNWSWKLIIDGIILENKQEHEHNSDQENIETQNIELLWHIFLTVSGITDL